MRRRQVLKTQATSSLPRSTLTRRTAVSNSVVAKSYFLPTSLPGCQLWLDSADNSSLVMDGTNVTTWRDKSGNGYHMNTIAGSIYWSGTPAYPTIGTSINGLQTVNFKAQSGLKQSTTLDGVKNLFWVGRIEAATGSSLGGLANFFLLGHDTHYDWHPPTGQKFIQSGAAQDGIANASPASLFTNDPNAVTNTAFSSINLPSPPNVSLLSVAGITGNSRYQGICYDRQTHTGWCGDLAEVIIFNSALTTAQRQAVEGYLAHKWGINKYYSPTFPLSIPGCQLWLDAGDSSTITGTTTVTQWRDKSGNSRHLGVGAGTTSYSSNAIQLNSSYMFVDSLVDLSKHNMFIVAKGTGQFNKAIFTAKPLFNVSWNSLDAFGFYLYTSDGAAYFANNVNDNGVGFSVNTTITQVYSCQTSGTLSSGWVNGSGQTNRTLNATRTTTARGFAIGAEYYNNMHNNSGAIASIYEILVYNSDFSITQRETIEKYLMQKWGLSGLSLTHPYYNFIPASLSAFLPTSISGCGLWLDSVDTSSMTFSSGSNISQWKDKSGLNNHATGFNSPVLTTSSINGNQAIATNSTAYFIGPVSVTGTTLTVFCVARITILPNGGNDQRLVSLVNGNNVDYGRTDSTIALFNQGNTSTIALWRTSGPIANNAIVANTPFLAVSGYDGTNGYLWKDGSAGTLASGASSGTFAITKYGVGGGAYIGEFWSGSIGEVIIYNTSLSTSERQAVEGYLSHKWRLNSSLPSDHLYKSIIPSGSTITPFLPTLIPGCALWLDGADTSSLVLSGSNITTWKDKSGYSNHFTPTSGTPTSISDNGRTVVNFTSGAIMRSANQITFTTSSAFFIVSRLNLVNASNAGMLIVFTDIGGGDFSIRFYGPNGPSIILAGTGGSGNGGDLANGTYYVNGTFNPSFTGSTYLNTYSLIGTVAPLLGGTSYLAFSSSYYERYFIGNIAEFLYYPGGVTTFQRQQVESYLAYKWGIQSTLPADHAYKTAPPSV